MRHGVKGNFKLFSTPLISSDSLSTFAQTVKRLGYTTAGFVSATPLKTHSGISVGFQTYDEPSAKTRNAETTTSSALEWLAKTKERPLFLWIHYWDPHHPYLPPLPFSKLYKTSDELLTFLHKKKFPEFTPKIRSAVLNAHNLYDGEITYVDTQLNRLLEGLKSNALYDNSVIVFTSDHGEGLGQHNWFDHGRIYNEQLFVPLIIKLPQKINLPGKRITNIVSLIDVLPTITKAINLQLTPKETSQFEGIDMLNENEPRHYVFSERVNRVRPGWEPGLKYSLTGPGWKYFHLTEGADELYDLSNDRPETKNVIYAHPNVAANMKALLLKQIDEYNKRQVSAHDEELLPPSIIEELKSLGYVEP
jgi:arylsulfatase A-like enzyme